jgi:hypothetical protein
MMTNTFTLAVNEKDVENLFRQYLTKKFGDIMFTSPFGCDGFGESKKHNVRLLCEFKDDLDLTTKVNQVKVLSQAIYYIKKFELSGKVLPSVIFIGDRNECFAIHTNEIFGYLAMDLDWSIAPSNAHTNIGLVSLMLEDDKIAPHVFSVKDIDQCVDKIKDLTDGVKRLIPITPHNVTEVFKHFEDKVIGKHNLDTNQMANLFVQLLVNPDQNYLHPVARRKTVVTRAFNEITLKSREAFTSFFSHFSREYTPKQREHLTAVVDRLVQDVTRRKQGEFFTPTIWVDKAHEYIASVYGDDWKEKYVVWDPAWGTGNLTRDYKFKELYVSTLVYADIETANQMGYNPEATKFQFDFLNDPYEYLPKGLKNAIESGKQIIVLMNPPYARAAANGKNNKVEKGAGDTVTSRDMKNDGWSGSSNLQAQFFYRIFGLSKNNIHIGVFCKPNYLTSPSFIGFRKKFFSKFSFNKGFMFQASHFTDVSSVWGIHFAVFGNNGMESNYDFTHDLLNLDDNYEFIKLGEKNLYNTDNKTSLSDYNESINPKGDNIDFPKFSSALKIKDSVWGSGLKSGTFATMVSNANNVAKNANSVYIVNGGVGENVGKVYLNSKNILDVLVTFSARKSISGDWMNDKDEYLIPNVTHPLFNQYRFDSLVYSLFNSSSEQSSLRQASYKDQLWDIKNQFFWMSKEEMTNLANNGNYPELYNDARTDSDRYVYRLLFGEQRIYDQLSDEAKDVLDTATNLVRLSFGMRRNFADDTNHLNSWDSGYAQLKLLWKEYYPEQFKEFRDKYKVLEDKMKPMVYELGFLLK